MAGSRALVDADRVVGVAEGEDDDHIIGRLATYTNPDRECNGVAFVRSWADHGLDVDDLPEARQPVHVFQSACASVRGRRSGPKGVRMEVTADEVEHVPTSCSYQIGVKVWDRANRRIEYQAAMRMTFDKHTSDVTVDELDLPGGLAELETEIRAHFLANAKTIPGQKVRNAVRATILKVGGQNLRRKAGGLYFVPKTYSVSDGGQAKTLDTAPVLAGLKAVLADMYGDDADFYSIRLAGDEGERAMIAKHFTINANERARDLAERAIQRARAGKGQRGIRADLMNNLWNERRQLLNAVSQYEQLVTLEQTDLQANLRELDQALTDLQELADAAA
jgi:hypothetical protein